MFPSYYSSLWVSSGAGCLLEAAHDVVLYLSSFPQTYFLGVLYMY